MRPSARRLLVVPAAAVALLSGACAGPSAKAQNSCPAGDLPTKTPGTLTLQTGAVTKAPWVVGGSVARRPNDPRDGKGYDAAVGYALAAELGYDRAHVRWVGEGFAASIAPGAKRFDVGINQATIKDARRKDVDLSKPYWVTRTAVVTIEGRPLGRATSLEALEGVPLGTVTSDRLPRVPGVTYVEFPDYDALRGAVVAGEVQGLVTSFSAGMRIERSGREIVDADLVALLPPADGAEAYGLVLQKDSPLTPCVNDALAELREDGTLADLEKRWLLEEPGLHDLR